MFVNCAFRACTGICPWGVVAGNAVAVIGTAIGTFVDICKPHMKTFVPPLVKSILVCMLGTSSVTTATQAVAQHTNASATGLIKLVAISTGNASATGLIILVASMTGTCEAALSVLTSAMGTTCVGVFLTLIDLCTVQPWLDPYTPYADKTVASDTVACYSSSKASTLQAQHTPELQHKGGLVGSGITRHTRHAHVGIAIRPGR
jgi:hypothetical protein